MVGAELDDTKYILADHYSNKIQRLKDNHKVKRFYFVLDVYIFISESKLCT